MLDALCGQGLVPDLISVPAIRKHRWRRLHSDRLALHVSFEHAAGVPISGVTALQGVRDGGRVQPGQQVMVIGAAGGVGSLRLMASFP